MRRTDDAFGLLRRRLEKGIQLGLEVLIAGDIVRTVAIDPSIQSIAELALIVLVRTVLSIVLELEISGRWPWQAKPSKAPAADWRRPDGLRRLPTGQTDHELAGDPLTRGFEADVGDLIEAIA